MDKKSYFRNGLSPDNPNTPSPKEKKYKSDKAIVVRPRFEEPFYRNFDLYQTLNENLGPGTGYTHLNDYKSVAEFLEAKRNKLKNKYKASDSWIPEGKPGIKVRASLFAKIIKLAIDFPIDDQIGSGSIIGDAGTYSDSVPIGGETDEYIELNDFEDKTPDRLDFGRDYSSNENIGYNKGKPIKNKNVNPASDPLFGLPDGLENDSLEGLYFPSE